jgi:hypothetical protein
MDDSIKPVQIHRGALWEDVLQGIWLAGVLGMLLYPSMGLVLHQAGLASAWGQVRGFLLSGLVAGLTSLARTRIASLVLFDPEEKVLHDAVRIGSTIYLQQSLAFDQVECFSLARREKNRVLEEGGCEGEIPLEGRGELLLTSGRVFPVSNWVDEDSTLPSTWSRLLVKLNQAAELLELPLEETAEIAPPVWEIGRSAAWVTSIALTAGFLVVFAA